MNKEEFKRIMEYPIEKLTAADVRSEKEMEQVFFAKIELCAVIGRTIRLCLEHPDLAKEYYEGLPKATMD